MPLELEQQLSSFSKGSIIFLTQTRSASYFRGMLRRYIQIFIHFFVILALVSPTIAHSHIIFVEKRSATSDRIVSKAQASFDHRMHDHETTDGKARTPHDQSHSAADHVHEKSFCCPRLALFFSFSDFVWRFLRDEKQRNHERNPLERPPRS